MITITKTKHITEISLILNTHTVRSHDYDGDGTSRQYRSYDYDKQFYCTLNSGMIIMASDIAVSTLKTVLLLRRFCPVTSTHS